MSNAITSSGAGGNIISESETNRIKWNIGTNTGSYVVPFAKSSGNKIPLTLSITTAGVGSGYVLFSTYGGSTWDNNTYKPVGVTHMNSLLSGGTANNSQYVIDRFWIIDAQGYTTKPTVSITFTYLDAEWSASGNTITEANLLAQRFNTSLNKWADWLGQSGTCNTTNNTVWTGTVSPSNFYRSWTLCDQSSPLSVELVSFNAECALSSGEMHILWATASEVNHHYFVIERSFDMISWDSVGVVSGCGTGCFAQEYEYHDNTVFFLSDWSAVYYRLKLVDFDGHYEYSHPVYAYCHPRPPRPVEIIYIYPNPADEYFYYTVCSNTTRVVTVWLTDVLGRVLMRTTVQVQAGISQRRIDVSRLASGVYYLKVESSDGLSKDSKQILIQDE